MSLPARVLVLIPHYFDAEENGIYSSTKADQRAKRRLALERTLLAWRSTFGDFRELHLGRRSFQTTRVDSFSIDIVLLTNRDKHLLDDALLKRFTAKRHNIETANPRRLPFGAHILIKRHAGEYDWFVYSEDDLLLHDPCLFSKQSIFQNNYGTRRILQPNRFELNALTRPQKTYVDGPLPDAETESLWGYVNESKPTLDLETELGPVRFERARNPHSGFFMLSKEQAQYWISQPHFLDLDCSFYSPLESAGSLSLLKTFSLYKPGLPAYWYLEIEHQDTRISSMSFPSVPD